MIQMKLDDVMWERHFTTAKLARETGISRQAISQWRHHPRCHGGIKFSTLGKLCAALNCGVGDLLEYAPLDYVAASEG